MPEKNLCIPLLGAGRSKKGLDGKSPCVMVLLANIRPKERIGEKVGDPRSPLPLPYDLQRGGIQVVERKGHPNFLLPWKRRDPEPVPF